MSGRNNNLVKERMRMEDNVGKKGNNYYKRLDTLLFFFDIVCFAFNYF